MKLCEGMVGTTHNGIRGVGGGVVVGSIRAETNILYRSLDASKARVDVGLHRVQSSGESVLGSLNGSGEVGDGSEDLIPSATAGMLLSLASPVVMASPNVASDVPRGPSPAAAADIAAKSGWSSAMVWSCRLVFESVDEESSRGDAPNAE
jgi:hypothetical protein